MAEGGAPITDEQLTTTEVVRAYITGRLNQRLDTNAADFEDRESLDRYQNHRVLMTLRNLATFYRNTPGVDFSRRRAAEATLEGDNILDNQGQLRQQFERAVYDHLLGEVHRHPPVYSWGMVFTVILAAEEAAGMAILEDGVEQLNIFVDLAVDLITTLNMERWVNYRGGWNAIPTYNISNNVTPLTDMYASVGHYNAVMDVVAREPTLQLRRRFPSLNADEPFELDLSDIKSLSSSSPSSGDSSNLGWASWLDFEDPLPDAPTREELEQMGINIPPQNMPNDFNYNNYEDENEENIPPANVQYHPYQLPNGYLSDDDDDDEEDEDDDDEDEDDDDGEDVGDDDDEDDDDINQNGINQNGINQNGINQNGVNQNGIDLNGIDQNGVNENEVNQNEVNQNEVNLNALIQNALNLNEFFQNALNLNGFFQNGIDQNGFFQNGIDQNGEGPFNFGNGWAGGLDDNLDNE